jgi:hypothetical protein
MRFSCVLLALFNLCLLPLDLQLEFGLGIAAIVEFDFKQGVWLRREGGDMQIRAANQKGISIVSVEEV